MVGYDGFLCSDDHLNYSRLTHPTNIIIILGKVDNSLVVLLQ